MKAFLFVDLSGSHTNYKKKVPEVVKLALPDITVIDIDARSDELLQHYALRLLKESEAAVVCIKADGINSDIAVLMPLLEEIFSGNKAPSVLLINQHLRLQRIFGARPEITFKGLEEDKVLKEVKTLLS
jgi:hypothetical protein